MDRRRRPRERLRRRLERQVEYLYIDLGKTEQTLATPGLGTLASLTHRFTDNIVRVGLNYKWGGYGGGYGGGGY